MTAQPIFIPYDTCPPPNTPPPTSGETLAFCLGVGIPTLCAIVYLVWYAWENR